LGGDGPIAPVTTPIYATIASAKLVKVFLYLRLILCFQFWKWRRSVNIWIQFAFSFLSLIDKQLCQRQKASVLEIDLSTG